jgi:large subunit ribosomal protein L10
VETTVREPRPEKVAVVDEVQTRLESASAALLTEYRGLPVKEIEALRRALRAAGGEYKIFKNTLVRRAIVSGAYEALEPMLTGPTAIAFVDGDVVAVAKVLREFSRANPNLVVKGGVVGLDVLDAGRAAALAELPSREALLAQIAGLLAAPMQRMAGLLQAVPLKFAYALKALIEDQGGAPIVASDEPDVALPVDSEVAVADAPAADATEIDATSDVSTGDETEPAAAEAVTDAAATDTADSDTVESDAAPEATATAAEASEDHADGDAGDEA